MSAPVSDPARQIQTDRLILRRWTEADREPFAAINSDPEVMEYFPAPLDRVASDVLVERIERSFQELGFGLWAIQLRETGQFIGFTGLSVLTFEAAFTPAVEVGWRLARSAWGRGYATEAARAALTFGFGKARCSEIVSTTARSNERSQAVMCRLGMTRDPADDYDHPLVPHGHRLRPHVLFRLGRAVTPATQSQPRIEPIGGNRGWISPGRAYSI